MPDPAPAQGTAEAARLRRTVARLRREHRAHRLVLAGETADDVDASQAAPPSVRPAEPVVHELLDAVPVPAALTEPVIDADGTVRDLAALAVNRAAVRFAHHTGASLRALVAERPVLLQRFFPALRDRGCSPPSPTSPGPAARWASGRWTGSADARAAASNTGGPCSPRTPAAGGSCWCSTARADRCSPSTPSGSPGSAGPSGTSSTAASRPPTA
ncbi:hypothetical protein GCM10025734_12690 [Kitasatospora paranensis]|uniref:hypothetical protein n=1 Tax=Kitasatospora paranensis TaxID=258053 RepID=UPI0031EBFFF3